MVIYLKVRTMKPYRPDFWPAGVIPLYLDGDNV